MTEARKRAKRAASAKRNMLKGIKGDISAAKQNRSHGNGSGGGRLPSAEYVGSAAEVKRRDGSGRSSFNAEGSERYDDRGPAPTANVAARYHAPSLTVVKAPARPTVEPDYGRRGKGAPAVKARVDRVDEAIARKNAYARRGDYSGEGPALLPLPPIEVIKPYPRPEKVAVTYIIQGGSIVELDDYRVEPRVFRVDPLKGRRYTRVRLGAAGHMGPVTSVTRVLPPARRVTYHPGYDTSAWTRVRAPEELVYRALVML